MCVKGRERERARARVCVPYADLAPAVRFLVASAASGSHSNRMPAAAFVVMAKDAKLVSRGAARGVDIVDAAREAANTVLWQVRRSACTAHGEQEQEEEGESTSAAESSAGEGEMHVPALRDMAAVSAAATGAAASAGARVPDAVLKRLRQRCVRAYGFDPAPHARHSHTHTLTLHAPTVDPCPCPYRGLSAHGYTCALVALAALTSGQQQQQQGASPPLSPSRGKRDTSLAASLDAMLQRNLLQHAKQKASASEFRKQLLRRDVRETLQRHGPYLKSVFAHYAAADASTLAARRQSKSLNVQEFLLLLEHCKLLGGALNREGARRIFFSVQVVRSRQYSLRRLHYSCACFTLYSIHSCTVALLLFCIVCLLHEVTPSALGGRTRTWRRARRRWRAASRRWCSASSWRAWPQWHCTDTPIRSRRWPSGAQRPLPACLQPLPDRLHAIALAHALPMIILVARAGSIAW